MEINGTLADSDDYTIDRDGKLFLWSGGNSLGEGLGHFRFINMSIKSLGLLHTTKLPGHGPVSLHMTRFVVNAGGLASVDDFFLDSENATIDVAGKFLFIFAIIKLKHAYLSTVLSAPGFKERK